MNRKAGSNLLLGNVVFIVIVLVFLFGMGWYVSDQRSGASFWSDFYAKEISRVINSAESGDEVRLDVQSLMEIARENEVESLSEIFQFDNLGNRVCVSLSKARKSCYWYFNDVDIVDFELELGLGKDDGNVLKFGIKEREKDV
jgi:hypothetical protein